MQAFITKQELKMSEEQNLNNNKKKKILMLCDFPLMFSGVAVQANYLITQLIKTGKYSFKVFGGARKHEQYDLVKVNDDYIIKPVDNFGTKEQLRQALVSEKPDILLLFTDPRFFYWVWEMEDEIHQICPIAYWHVWDNDPVPVFNKPLYESTDLINCLSDKTYNLVRQIVPNKNVNYVPHSLPEDLFRPLSDVEITKWKQQILKNRWDHFVCLWVNRNAHRKKPVDLIWAWKEFVNNLEKKYGHKRAVLVMHTDPFDREGSNLIERAGMFGVLDQVTFSTDKLSLEQMNVLYNIADCGVNISSSEGFGLNALESLYCEKPLISIKTGGLTRQIVNVNDQSENGVAIQPGARRFIGGGDVPYIFEDHVNIEDVTNAFMQVYEWGTDKRKEVGTKARKYALSEFNFEKMISSWDDSLEHLVLTWRQNYKSWSLTEI